MPRILQSIHLSDYQARVLLLAHQAQTPELAFAELGQQDRKIESNLIGARDALSKLGLLEVGENYLTVTEQGQQVMSDEYLIDEMGEVTEKGNEILNQFVTDQPAGQQGPADQAAGNPTGTDMGPAAAGGEMETTPGEGGIPTEGSIFRQVHDLSKLIG